jgi:Ser/Thr protein kinase RdoA (MazF antagonist)
MVLEDLDQPSLRGKGFPDRKSGVSADELLACLSWLANFHAAYIGIEASAVDDKLWPVGTYWHLATRWDEWDVMEAGKLKEAASTIDRRLNNCKFQTLVHGDAKLANFCFPVSSGPVAAVDFQYVGRGCGMKDVAYLISSCLSDSECKRQQETLLNSYFRLLEAVVDARQDIQFDFKALESEWRELYRFAWADFYRFLAGWSPGHWKMHGYSDEITNQVIHELG